MFAGEHINVTEDRAVLHTALRDPEGVDLEVDGQDVVADVHDVLGRVYAFADDVRSGAWTGVTGRADPDRGEHRHRRLRPRSGDGLRGARGVPPGRSRVPVHLQHRPDRRGHEARRPRPRDDAVHRVEQDVRHPRDAHQRPPVQGLAAGGAERPRRRATPSASTSSRCRPRSTRSRRSASTRPTRSASGTGSAGATRWTPPSVRRSRSRSVPSGSPRCWPASTRWTSTSAPPSRLATCRC